jgi:hypothetical protein
MESEIAGLRSRRTVLADRLARADADIERALSDRRRRLVETDSDESDVESTPQVGQLREVRAGFADAVAALDSKIAEVSTQIDEARDRARREAAARKLNGVTDELTKLADDYAAVVSRLPAVLGAVVDRLPYTAVSRSHTVMFANEVLAALRMVVSESRSHATQVVSGAGQICEPAAQPPAPPPKPPAIERQSVFLRYAGRWVEDGETKTCGPHVAIELPVEVARLALSHNHGVPADSRAAADLRGLQDPCYAYWPPDRCIDLTQPRPVPQPPDQMVTAEFIPSRQPIIGTAIAR